ncbi:MAG TPA: hypothetical protein VFM25_12965, partial [Verrucomicrobiae bacterium]|nr:hypothetical protein [Verrucomicrobiae bacterium]
MAHWREWEINPVVVKELRQAVRSWAVTGTLLLFLVVLFCTAFGNLVSRFDTDIQAGGSVFRVFLIILSGASLAFIPLYVGVRLASERQDSNLDLLYITTLTPGRIIRGKLFCGAYMAILFFSACMPFMAFTTLMRGVDLPTIFFILICLFLAVCLAVQGAIFLACLPVTRVLKILVAIFGVMWMFSAVVPIIFIFLQMVGSGVGSMMGSGQFWMRFFTTCILALAGGLLFYFLSVAMISPISANRALPVRSYITVSWILGGLFGVYEAIAKSSGLWTLTWSRISYFILCASLVVIVSNHDELSVRVRRAIPQNPAKRALAFLFFNGAAGGLV